MKASSHQIANILVKESRIDQLLAGHATILIVSAVLHTISRKPQRVSWQPRSKSWLLPSGSPVWRCGCPLSLSLAAYNNRSHSFSSSRQAQRWATSNAPFGCLLSL